MQTLQTTDELLLSKGYTKYRRNEGLDPDILVCRFQKCFQDAKGKKYFIDVLKYDHSFIPVNRRTESYEPYGYEYELHFDFERYNGHIKMTLFAGWTIDDVEKYAEEYFEKMNPDYYETD